MSAYTDLKFNGSGYYDYTAYRAIRNMEEEKLNSKENYQEGDIVVVSKPGGYRDEVLLVRLHDDYASGVTQEKSGLRIMHALS